MAPQFRNLLLNALTAEARSALSGALRPVTLDLEHEFFRPGDRPAEVWFVEQGVVSLVTLLQDGSGVETATIGSENALGLWMAVTGSRAQSLAVAQSQVQAFAAPADKIRDLVSANTGAMKVFGRAAEAVLSETQQSVTCNALHTLEPRLAKWLLRCRDRLPTDVVPLTQEFLSHMVGAQRTSVTTTLQSLARFGAVRTMRGRIEILDRAALEKTACECYEEVRRQTLELHSDLSR